MTNWHLIGVPHAYTPCERYGNAIIATYGGVYVGFAIRYETKACSTKAACRAAIDKAIEERL